MGRRVFVLSMVAGVGTMLAGVGVIVFQPRSLLPPCFGYFHCFGGPGPSTIEVAGAALYFTLALIPVALAFSIWLWFLRQWDRGTAAVAHDQGAALIRNHPSLRLLSSATILLALIAGGLIVQAGYMHELTSDY